MNDRRLHNAAWLIGFLLPLAIHVLAWAQWDPGACTCLLSCAGGITIPFEGQTYCAPMCDDEDIADFDDFQQWTQTKCPDGNCWPEDLHAFYCAWRNHCLQLVYPPCVDPQFECDFDGDGDVDLDDFRDATIDFIDQTEIDMADELDGCSLGREHKIEYMRCWLEHCFPGGLPDWIDIGDVIGIVIGILPDIDPIEIGYVIEPIIRPCPDCEDPGLPGDGDPEMDREDSTCDAVYTDDPVNLANGAKAEFDVDVTVVAPGWDFTIHRMVTSNPLFSRAGLIGSNQTLSSFDFIEWRFDITDWPLAEHSIDLYQVGSRRRFSGGIAHYLSPPLGRYDDDSPNQDYFESGFVQIRGNYYAVWNLVRPREWTRSFYRVYDGGYEQINGSFEYVRPTPLWLENLLATEEDSYGNSRVYDYAPFVRDDEEIVARLFRIRLNPLGGHEDALHGQWRPARDESPQP